MNTPNTDPVSPSVLPSPAQPQPPTSLPSSALNAQSTTPNSAPNATVLPKAAPKPIPEPPLIPYTGLPSSFPKKLPHRNWFIFAAVVSIPTYLWWDDRQQAKALKEAYLDRVRHLGREPLEGGALGGVRTCAVYASRWPGEEDGKARDWWKKYVKPYLVASATDYTLPNLPHYSSLTTLIADQYHLLRSLSSPSSPPVQKLTPTSVTPVEEYERLRSGGVMLVGRQSLKEYMEGLRRGWRSGERVVQDGEEWVKRLDDSIFEDPVARKAKEEAAAAMPAGSDSLPTPLSDVEAAPAPPAAPPAGPPVSLFPLTHLPAHKTNLPFNNQTPPLPPPLPTNTPLPSAPSSLPPHPPLILIPYHPDLGFASIPRSILGFFNTREQVRLGAEAALSFILNQPSKEFSLPSEGGSEHIPSGEKRFEGEQEMRQAGELDWDLDVGELKRIPKNFEKFPGQIDERMRAYYTALEGRVAKAWEIKNGRELTEAEVARPPLTLEGLREERIKRERRAKTDLDGYHILRKGSGVAWDEGLRGKMEMWEWDSEGKTEGERKWPRMMPVNTEGEEEEQ